MAGNTIEAVILNGSPTGLAAVRSLGRAGILTAVVQTKDSHMAAFSRWAAESHDLFDFQDEPERLLELLEWKARDWRGAVLLPACDRTLTLLSRHREALSRHYRVGTPPGEVVDALLNKELTYRHAREIGVDIPTDYGPAGPATAARPDLTFPVVVKPVLSHDFSALFGQKLFVARDREELNAAIGKLQGTGIEARIQDLIPGPDSQFYNYTVFLDARGDPMGECGFHKMRKSPPFFGVGRMSEPWDATPLRERTLELLRRIGWTGVASAEYKLDPRDGSYRLMEVNGRFFLMHGLSYRLGVDYPLQSWLMARGQSVPRQRPNGWDGIWVDLRAELVYSVFLRGIEGLTWRETLAPYRRRKTYAVLSASDPRPFAYEQRHLLRTGWTTFRSRRSRAGMERRMRAMIPAH